MAGKKKAAAAPAADNEGAKTDATANAPKADAGETATEKKPKKGEAVYTVKHGSVKVGPQDKRTKGMTVTEAELGGAYVAKALIADGTIEK